MLLWLEREQHFRQNCPSVSIPRFRPHFGCLQGHFWCHFGSLKASRTSPQGSKWSQNAPKWRSKTDQNQKSWNFKKPSFFQRFLMIFDASKTQKCMSWTSFNHFWLLKSDVDLPYVILGALWASRDLIWAVSGRPGGSLGAHLGAHEAPLRVSGASLGRHFFVKIESSFAYPFLELILDASGPLWGAILAPQSPPERFKMTLFLC